MVEDFDPTTIEDEGLRQVFISLMNLVEHLSVKVAEQAEEIQRLRDENNRLKGEQGKPKILPQHQSEHRTVFRKRTSCVQTAPQNQQACSDQDRPGRGGEG